MFGINLQLVWYRHTRVWIDLVMGTVIILFMETLLLLSLSYYKMKEDCKFVSRWRFLRNFLKFTLWLVDRTLDIAHYLVNQLLIALSLIEIDCHLIIEYLGRLSLCLDPLFWEYIIENAFILLKIVLLVKYWNYL